MSILLQPISPSNQYLFLDQLYHALLKRESRVYRQWIADNGQVRAELEPATSANMAAFTITMTAKQKPSHSRLITKTTAATEDADSVGEALWLETCIQPEPHLLVIGGGVDAQPVINLAAQLGWETSLWDPRPANARREYFPTANHIPNCSVEALADYVQQQRVNAVVIMSHNVMIDAQALAVLQNGPLSYMALLGPGSRRANV